MTEAKVVGHLGPAKIKVTVAQPEVLPGQHRTLLVGHLERQRPGAVQQLGALYEHLHLPGGVACVLRSLHPISHGAMDRDYRLPAEGLEQTLQALDGRAVIHGLWIEHRLCGAIGVREVKEQHSAMVAGEPYPTCDDDFLSQVVGAKLSACVRSHHYISSLCSGSRVLTNVAMINHSVRLVASAVQRSVLVHAGPPISSSGMN